MPVVRLKIGVISQGRNKIGVIQPANPFGLSMSQVILTGSRDPCSIDYIGSIQIHGTQLLLVSSNRFDSWHRSP